MGSDSNASWRECAANALASMFFGLLTGGGVDFGSFEESAMLMGHEAIADAMGRALERFDAELCASLPDGCRLHDVRRRTLATEVGDVSFRCRRVRDR